MPGSNFVDPGMIELVREVTSVEDALLCRTKNGAPRDAKGDTAPPKNTPLAECLDCSVVR
jgi:hypothetical protein